MLVLVDLLMQHIFQFCTYLCLCIVQLTYFFFVCFVTLHSNKTNVLCKYTSNLNDFCCVFFLLLTLLKFDRKMSEKLNTYLVAITIIEGRHYIWDNMSSAVLVRVGNKKKSTAVQKCSDSPFYNEVCP